MAHRWMHVPLSAALALQLGCGSIECPAGLFRDEQQCTCPPGKTLVPESVGPGHTCVDSGPGDAGAGDPEGRQPAGDGGTGRRADEDGGELAPPRSVCTESSPERCDSRDNDCDGRADEGLGDVCGACRPINEVCDGKDNDCDQLVDEGLLNRCGTCGELPAEFCDDKDNDCDGRVDEEVEAAPSWYPDCDFDGFAPAVAGVKACRRPPNANGCDWTQVAPGNGTTDCQDKVREIHPGAGFGLLPDSVVLTPPTIPGMDFRYADLNCNGTVEGSEAMAALWDGGPIPRFLSPLPDCSSGTCPCLDQPIAWDPPYAGAPFSCPYGYNGRVRTVDDRGLCLPVRDTMVVALCR